MKHWWHKAASMHACISTSWVAARAKLAPLVQRAEPFLSRLKAHVGQLWQAYKAWSLAREMRAFDRQFLPAVIELQETPPSPTARYFLRGVCLMVTFALLWAIFGTIDIIAAGQGKTVPTGRVKVIQPLEAGLVSKLLVEDGMHVKTGATLVELDVTLTQADEERLRDENMMLEADIARLNALLSHAPLPDFSDLPTSLRLREANLYMEIASKNAAELASLREELAQRRSDYADAKQQVDHLQSSAHLLKERSTRLTKLVKEGFYAKNRFALDESERLRLTRDLETQRQRLLQTSSAISAAEEHLAAAEAEQRRTLLAELSDKEERHAAVTKELAKASQRNRQQTLRAPIDGLVQELAVHTIGGVVTPAQELMKIVPFNDALEAEVLIPNKDIGFVKEGQDVAIKLEAFPFTKYGILDGRVKSVSLDAIPDENLGLVYKARISLNQATLRVGDKDVLLTPGLAITGEIKTGTRRIIEYFLSPLMEYADESIRER